MASHVAHVVQNQAVGLPLQEAQRTAKLLAIHRITSRRPPETHDLDRRQVEPLSEQVDVHKLPYLARPKPGEPSDLQARLQKLEAWRQAAELGKLRG